MSNYVLGRKSLITVVVLVCAAVAQHPEAAIDGSVAVQGGCGPSMRGVDRLKADLGLDNMLATRANSLASSALGNGQAPPANAIQSLTEDSLDGLTDAGDQLDQAADQISQQLDAMNLPRQQRAWSRGVSDMKAARTSLRSALRQDPIAPGQQIGSLSATGVGPRVMYEAATTYQNSVESLGSIADQGGFVELGQKNWIAQGNPDTPPPPNPGPDPWQEWLRRLQAQQARIRNNINGLNAARALQAGQFQQAQQNAAEMQRAVQAAQNVANQLSQLAALCQQAANQQQTQSNQPAQSAQPTQPPASQPAASAAGGGIGAGTAAVVVVGAAAGGYALYKALVCTEPDYQSSLTGCTSGSCSACAAFLEMFVPYCDCLEQKGQEAPGTCGQFRTDVENFRRNYCLVPRNMTPLPNPIWR